MYSEQISNNPLSEVGFFSKSSTDKLNIFNNRKAETWEETYDEKVTFNVKIIILNWKEKNAL